MTQAVLDRIRLTRAAISSMNDSCANVFCSRLGERSGPVKNGDRIVCVRTRSLSDRAGAAARAADAAVT